MMLSYQVKEAQNRLMFLKTKDNLKDVIYINAVLQKYLRFIELIEEV